MTPEQFDKWVSEMRKLGVHTDKRCASLLGISRRTFIRYKEKGCGLTVALACHALTHNIGPYK